MKKTWIAWAVWIAMVFGITNCFGPSGDARAPGGQSVVDRIRAHFRVDDDTIRYFTYANAILGRPYQNYFIRGLAGWRRNEILPAENSYGITQPTRPLVPWREFCVEYPPGMLPLILAPALVTQDFDVYHRLFCLEMDLALTAALAFTVALARRLRPDDEAELIFLSTMGLAALGVIALRRYDPALSLLVCGAIYALSRRRTAAAGAAMAAAVMVKITPVLLAPLALMEPLARRDRRGALVGFGVAVAALGGAILASVLAFGPNMLDLFTYHSERPPQFESLYAGVLLLAQAFDPGLVTLEFSHGSYNVLSPYSDAMAHFAGWALLLACGGVYLVTLPALANARDDNERLSVLIRACCAIFAAFIVFNKVGSPQYYVWLLPLGALAALEAGETSRNLLVGAFLLSQLGNILNDPDSPSALGGLTSIVRCAVTLAWGLRMLAPSTRCHRSRVTETEARGAPAE